MSGASPRTITRYAAKEAWSQEIGLEAAATLAHPALLSNLLAFHEEWADHEPDENTIAVDEALRRCGVGADAD